METERTKSCLRDDSDRLETPCDAHALLPHGAPFSLVDQIIGILPDGGISRSTVRPENPLLDAHGELAREAFPEYAAQTAAALDSLKHGGRVSPGFLVEVADSVFSGSAREGSSIEAETRVEYEFGRWRGIRFRVAADGTPVAEGLLKICIFD